MVNREVGAFASAYDRIEGEKGKKIASAAFDQVALSAEEVGKATRETAVAVLRAERRRKKKNPTGKQVRLDAWLAPSTLSVSGDDPEVSRAGVRASDKGFLEMAWRSLRMRARRRSALPGRRTVGSNYTSRGQTTPCGFLDSSMVVSASIRNGDD